MIIFKLCALCLLIFLCCAFHAIAILAIALISLLCHFGLSSHYQTTYFPYHVMISRHLSSSRRRNIFQSYSLCLFFKDAYHLKPLINRSLANAEFYCMALSVLYADPNFHNLNHWGIIQALARKGICVAEPSDCSLTESVLIQTSPLKMVINKMINER